MNALVLLYLNTLIIIDFNISELEMPQKPTSGEIGEGERQTDRKIIVTTARSVYAFFFFKNLYIKLI